MPLPHDGRKKVSQSCSPTRRGRLSTPDERSSDRLSNYDGVADPELVRLATTVSAWESEFLAGFQHSGTKEKRRPARDLQKRQMRPTRLLPRPHPKMSLLSPTNLIDRASQTTAASTSSKSPGKFEDTLLRSNNRFRIRSCAVLWLEAQRRPRQKYRMPQRKPPSMFTECRVISL